MLFQDQCQRRGDEETGDARQDGRDHGRGLRRGRAFRPSAGLPAVSTVKVTSVAVILEVNVDLALFFFFKNVALIHKSLHLLYQIQLSITSSMLLKVTILLSFTMIEMNFYIT